LHGGYARKKAGNFEATLPARVGFLGDRGVGRGVGLGRNGATPQHTHWRGGGAQEWEEPISILRTSTFTVLPMKEDSDFEDLNFIFQAFWEKETSRPGLWFRD